MNKHLTIFQTSLCLLFLSQNAFCPPKSGPSRTTRGRLDEKAKTCQQTSTPVTPGTTGQPSVAELLLGYSPTRKDRRRKQPEPKPTFRGKGIYPSQETGCNCQDDIHSDCRMNLEEGAIRCLIGLSLKPGDPECIASLDSHIAILSGGLTQTNSEDFARKYSQFIRTNLPQVITLTKQALENIKTELKIENLNEMETILISLRSVLRFYFKYLNGQQVADIPDYRINPEIMLYIRVSMESETTLKFKFLYIGRAETKNSQDYRINLTS